MSDDTMWVVQGRYQNGRVREWEDLTASMDKGEAQEDQSAYVHAEPGTPFRVVPREAEDDG